MPKKNTPGCGCCGKNVAIACDVTSPYGSEEYNVRRFTNGGFAWGYSQSLTAGRALRFDSSGKLYFLYSDTVYIISSSGSLVTSFSTTSGARDLAVDSSGNIYVCYYRSSNSPTVEKYNSSGTKQWSASISVTGATNWTLSYSGIDATAAGRVVISGRTQYTLSGTIYHTRHTMCYDTTGSEQWRHGYSSDTHGDEIRAVAIDTSGNAYSSHPKSGGPTWTVLKHDASGTEETTHWPRTYDASDVVYDLVCDGSDNVYVLMWDNSASAYRIVKYDSDNSLQWTSSASIPGLAYASDTKYLAVDETGHCYMPWKKADGTYWLAMLSSDGSSWEWTHELGNPAGSTAVPPGRTGAFR